MTATRSALSICTVLLIFCTNSLTASGECERDILFYIRARGLDLYLDATDPQQVKVEKFTGADAQVWRFQPAGRPGLYYIFNEHHRKVLDVVPGTNDPLVVSEAQNKTQQKWNFDFKDNIVNAANGKNVDINNNQFFPGNFVKLWDDNGCGCQAFHANRKE